MTRSRTQLQMRTEVRVQSDMVNSNFVTDPNINYWLNQSLNALWEMVGNADPDRYVTEQTITTVSGTKEYLLPTDFYKTRYVELLIGGSSDDRVTIEPYQMAEKNRYKWLGIWGGQNYLGYLRYRLIGQNMTFEPDPGANTFKHGYMQLFTELSSDGDTFDGVAGWEEWAVLDVVRKVLRKEESDVTDVVMDMAAIEQRLLAHANDRDMSRAPLVQDTRTRAAFRRQAY